MDAKTKKYVMIASGVLLLILGYRYFKKKTNQPSDVLESMLNKDLVLEKGSKGAEVVELQRILVDELGYDLGTSGEGKDGTTKNQLSSPNGKYADACINNGGRADLTEQQKFALEKAKIESEKAMYDAQKNKTTEPIYYILVTAGVMIAGYFAYKKFKK